jgi:hypothetical protein
MPQTHTRSGSRGGPAAVALVILLLACIGLVACGGSSSTTSSSANAASTGGSSSTSSSGTSSSGTSSSGSNATPPPAGRGPARFAAMRECLQKNGITLPARPSGAGAPRGGGFLGGGANGPTLPKGVTRAQYEAALKKCGAGRLAGGGAFGRARSPVFKQALSKFAACMRQNGIDIPVPNTSGNGPIFSTKGIKTNTPQFRAATGKCRGTLTGAFRRPSGGAGAPAGGGAPGAGGAPPAGAQTQGGEENSG